MTLPPPPPPPGPTLQSINRLLHTAPFSFLFYGLYWSFVLIVASPLAGIFLILLTALRCVRYAVLLPLGKADGERIRPGRRSGRGGSGGDEGGGKEYGVVVTGCDSGFGHDVALELSRRGFVVFAGCLSRDAVVRLRAGRTDDDDDDNGVVPLQMNVTKQEEVDGAVKAVNEWIASAKPGSPRVLHALVNNAGVGTGGLIDWIELENARKDMEVNYFGMIRVVKAFLPILKSQASSRIHEKARILNMVSVAGLNAAGIVPSYHGSKFAAEAFSDCLRHEMRAFGISVVTVNPTMHQTPLTNSMEPGVKKQWQSLNPKLREEYGEAFFEQYFVHCVHKAQQGMWRAHIVVDQMVACVELISPPSQCVIGTDGKYGFLLLRHLPVWAQDMLLSTALPCRVKPALMTSNKR